MAITHPERRGVAVPTPLPRTRVAIMLAATILVGLIAYYFTGIDEGAASVFGKSVAIHEWVHDARHFLGFPCH